MLFTPAKIGNLTLPNRLIRSATAECMADAEGVPRPELADFYRELARGGVGLIITGHMYVHPSGNAHEGMTGVYSDELVPHLAGLAGAVHEEGGLVAVQINHGGMHSDAETVSETLAPSASSASFLERPAREMTLDEIAEMIEAYGQAARRVKEAGFDAVQIHGAHGYLVSQFLSPFTNRRSDEWGGDLEGRMRFLGAVSGAVRVQVGLDYPVFIKLGMWDAVEGGLTPSEGAQVAGALADMGLDGLEISGGLSGGTDLNTRKGVRSVEDEAYFRHLAQAARGTTDLPIALVGGFRTREVMDEVLEAGDADFIAMCRPLICEPDLPNLMRKGLQERSRCISANLCWPDDPDEGVACRCNLKD
jgi:2,4-dienoyl-CoA reductase-like NADH-dependent reductase (Old Yellow Enzyme family)